MDNRRMIDPTKVTNFKRTPEELEEFLLFSIVVAGKGAFQQATKLQAFLGPWIERGYTPFGAIRTMDMDGSLVHFLKEVKMGQYNRVSSAFRAVAHFFRYDDESMRYHPIFEIAVKHLEVFKGIGMKTARFFIMHSRPHQQLACLDTHILRWLGEKGHEVPKTTPNGQKYLNLEKIFLAYAKDMNILPADLDLQIWNSVHPKKVEEKI